MTILISYSRTGNNQALAKKLAKQLKATHIPLTQPASKSMFSLVLDMIFKRTPSVEPTPDQALKSIKKDDLVLLAGPVWMGQVASPLRSFLDYLKDNPHRYGFISISGGSVQLGDQQANPNLENELNQRTGRKPDVLINKYIADLLPQDPKPTMQQTSKYKITPEDIEKLTQEIVKAIQK